MVAQELQCLVQNGTLKPVERSEWVSPITCVPKQDGGLWICGDYKLTIKRDLDVHQFPLPTPSNLFACLSGGKGFTKLDLASAYQQMPLEEESCNFTTFNTHKGLFTYTRLPFSSAAPALFQRNKDTMLQGIPQALCYIDNILITGKSRMEHLANMEDTLQQLQEHGVHLKLENCGFLQFSVEFLGDRVDSQGIHTTQGKLSAIK